MASPFKAETPGQVKSLAVVVVVTVVLGLLQPFLWKLVSNTAESVHIDRSQRQQITEVGKRVKSIEEKYNSEQVFLEQLTSVVPRHRNTLQVIERLESLAAELGVNIEVTSIEETLLVLDELGEKGAKQVEAEINENTEKIEMFPLIVSVIIKAPPDQLLAYIDSIEHVQELTEVQKINIAQVAVGLKQGEPDTVEFVLQMDVAFYLQEDNDG